MDLDAVPPVSQVISWYYRERVMSLRVLEVHVTGPAPNDYIAKVRIEKEDGTGRDEFWQRRQYKNFLRRVLPYRTGKLTALFDWD